MAGHAPQPGRKTYSDLKARILTILRDYGNRNTLEYFFGIAHNLVTVTFYTGTFYYII